MDKLKGMLWGLVVGDCLGSPIQFSEKDDHVFVDSMLPCDLFNLPKGYWTDDSSMSFCIMDSFLRCNGYNREDVANTFLRWYRDGYLSSVPGRSFDVGIATSEAMNGIARGHFRNGREDGQGNGSIMRLGPTILIQRAEKQTSAVDEISNITHDSTIVRSTATRMAKIIECHLRGEKTSDRGSFTSRLEAGSSGWCVSTLDSALWAFHTTSDFREGMIAAVNLGEDSDTIGAVYGQIAGAYYGLSMIPEEWVNSVHRSTEVNDLITRFVNAVNIRQN